MLFSCLKAIISNKTTHLYDTSITVSKGPWFHIGKMCSQPKSINIKLHSLATNHVVCGWKKESLLSFRICHITYNRPAEFASPHNYGDYLGHVLSKYNQYNQQNGTFETSLRQRLLNNVFWCWKWITLVPWVWLGQPMIVNQVLLQQHNKHSSTYITEKCQHIFCNSRHFSEINHFAYISVLIRAWIMRANHTANLMLSITVKITTFHYLKLLWTHYIHNFMYMCRK